MSAARVQIPASPPDHHLVFDTNRVMNFYTNKARKPCNKSLSLPRTFANELNTPLNAFNSLSLLERKSIISATFIFLLAFYNLLYQASLFRFTGGILSTAPNLDGTRHLNALARFRGGKRGRAKPDGPKNALPAKPTDRA